MYGDGLFSSIVIVLVHQVTPSCYFPVEIQGEFMTQSMVDQEIAYSTVSVLYNSIPGWGVCHKRHGARIILEDKTVNGDTCFKCLRIDARSKNVIQIHTRDLHQCFNSEQDALFSCPNLSDVAGGKVNEIMLYKTRGFYGESAVSEVLCPINGKWRFTYTNRGDEESSCASPASRAGDCPTGYKFELQFRGCNFPNKEMHFKCMGDWKGEDGQNYLALLDTNLPQLGEEIRPRYRCAIYKEDRGRGYTWMALSNDSTCTHQLDSHSAGYEMLQLHSMKQPIRASRSYSLPKWAQGEWESVSVKGGQLIYKSDEEFTSYSAETISSPNPNRYLVRIETSCGHEAYACLALEQRSDNIIELMIGKHSKSSHQRLCDQEHFLAKHWLTLGKDNVRSSCPLVGEFSGALPDAEGLCARSVTSCDRSDQMNYQVYNCENTTEVYEDRSYHCFGAFEENGLVYTVVQRLDLPFRECFVGTDLVDGRSMITEAGTSCGREKEPGKSGMLLSYRSEQCVHWQWEEANKELFKEVIDTDIEKSNPKHMPNVTKEVSMETTAKASLIVKEVNDDITQIPKEITEYKTLNKHKTVIKKTIDKVKSVSNATQVNYNLALLVISVSIICT